MMLYNTIKTEGAMQKAARLGYEDLVPYGAGALGGVLANMKKSLASKIAGGVAGAVGGNIGTLAAALGYSLVPSKYLPKNDSIERYALAWPIGLGGAGLGGYGAGKLGGNLASWIENKIKGAEEPQQ